MINIDMQASVLCQFNSFADIHRDNIAGTYAKSFLKHFEIDPYVYT
jgi:uncharacterized radical SAM superfamily Fe-S cluster-containing enzyme